MAMLLILHLHVHHAPVIKQGKKNTCFVCWVDPNVSLLCFLLWYGETSCPLQNLQGHMTRLLFTLDFLLGVGFRPWTTSLLIIETLTLLTKPTFILDPLAYRLMAAPIGLHVSCTYSVLVILHMIIMWAYNDMAWHHRCKFKSSKLSVHVLYVQRYTYVHTCHK